MSPPIPPAAAAALTAAGSARLQPAARRELENRIERWGELESLAESLQSG